MRQRPRWGWVVGIALVAIGGCGVDVSSSDDDGAESSASGGESPSANRPGTQPRSEDPGSSPTSPSDSASVESGRCPVGTWRLRDLRAIGDADATRIEFSGGGSLTLTFTAVGTWTLTDDASQPLQASLATDGYRVDGRVAIDGSATGTYRSVGSAYVFDLLSSSGEATISGPGYNDTVDIDEVAEALLPVGRATLDCADSTLRLHSDSVRMTLAPSRDPGPISAAGSGDKLTVESSGTRDCSSRSVRVDAGLEDVFLTGECGVVTVVGDNTELTAESIRKLVVPGSLNEITVDTVATISVSGSSNEIFWGAARAGGEPTIHDDGPFNTVQQR